MTPPPVVLVHGFGATARCWRSLAVRLRAAGFVVFALDYGRTRRRGGGGFTDTAKAAAELSAFIEEVCLDYGAEQVDVVAHSYGALVTRYYLKRLDGSLRTRRVVGLAPTWNGTTFNGVLRVPVLAKVAARLVHHNLLEQATGSSLLSELGEYEWPDTVKVTVISPRRDRFTTPVTIQQVASATNIRLAHPSGHLSVLSDVRTARHVLRVLSDD